MEIAKLEAIITADIKPLTVALEQAQTEIGQFATQGSEDFTALTAGLSQTAKAALAAGTDIRSLTAALDVLQAEQSGIIKGTTLWQLYETEIKKVNGQLDILEAQLPIITKESQALAASSGGIGNIGRSIGGILTPIRQLAYILPGIGLAGLFNLAFEAIQKAAEELKIFNNQAKELEDATNKAIDNISEEANKVSILVSQLQNENLTRVEKLNNIQQLQNIAPGYFSNLKLEGDAVVNLTDDYAKFGQAIILVAKIKAASDLNQKNVTAGIQEQLRTSQALALLEQKRGFLAANNLNFEDEKLKLLERQLEDQTKLAQQSKPLLDIITEAERELNALGGDPSGKTTKALEAIKTHLKEIKQVAVQTKDAFIDWVDPTDLSQLNTQLTRTPALMKEVAGWSEKMVNALRDKRALAEFNKQLMLMQNIAEGIADTFANIFTELATTGKVSFQTLTKEVINYVAALIKAKVETLILKLLTAALNPGTAALGGALNFAGLFGLAEGGVVSKPTVALIGESGPEAVIPLNQIAQISNNVSQNLTINGLLKVQGSDLVLALNRGNVRISRNMGGNFTN